MENVKIPIPSQDEFIFDYNEYLQQAKLQFDARWLKYKCPTIVIDDYEQIKTLGMGFFGRVMLVKHRKHGNYFAMKILQKAKVVQFKQIEHILNEKRILETIRFPFVVSMYSFTQDNSYLYFALPFLPGGELFTLLRRLKKFEEGMSKFYAAQIVLVLEYLHEVQLVYRDLKPDNILLDRQGYIKLTDFGFCKMIKGRTWTLCGTPEYLAPEMILSKGYGLSVDWWAYGVLVYEMCAGYTPFYASKPIQIYEKIIAANYKNPTHFSHDLKDIIKNLLHLDLSRRFGNLKNGVCDIKNHKWFRGLDWMDLVNKRIEPPFLPKCSGAGDTSNFYNYEEVVLRVASEDQFEKEFDEF